MTMKLMEELIKRGITVNMSQLAWTILFIAIHFAILL